MPAHRVKGPPTGTGPAAAAVARVLAGTPTSEAAKDAHLDPELLERLLEVFTEAGYRAVDEHTAHGTWWQADVEFDPHHRGAVQELTELLNAARSDGYVNSWWFLHKHPGWRLRLHLATSDTRSRLQEALDALVDHGTLHGWWPGVYEPETAAFGGSAGMGIAHELFCADSDNIARLGAEVELPLGRKQISVMLCTELMRAAGLEPVEHGDVWDLVCALRPLPDDVDPARVEAMLGPAKTLTGADTAPAGAMFGAGGPLQAHTAWAAAFSRAGYQLAGARRDGVLHRGIRRVVAHHVIFHWNRLALPATAQAALARAARAAILDIPVHTEASAP